MERRRVLALVGAALTAGCGAVTDRRAEATDAGTTVRPPDPETSPTPATTGVDGATESGEGPRSPTAADGPGGAVERTPTATPVHAGYETTTVVVRTPDDERLGAVTAAIADTPTLRYRGLSETPSLPEDRGMLFVFGSAGRRTFVMRGMAFGIDIVYADADGTITRIHHAPAPAPGTDGSDDRYPGYGQYVLEVARGWTTDRGVATGDVLEFAL
jgi:uncharacterized membrane protein (UPF0127 family)